MNYVYCPVCGKPLIDREIGGFVRKVCPDAQCAYVHWNNPVPVVAAVVEHEGGIILARNKLWKTEFYGLVTGFLEKNDVTPDNAAQREVQEELGLQTTSSTFIGHYPFPKQNQIIIAFYIKAVGTIQLGDELCDWKRVAPADAVCWPSATGFALRDWLRKQGHEPSMIELPF